MSCAHPGICPCLAGLQENVFNSLTPTCQLFKWNLNALLDKFISASIIHIIFHRQELFRDAICWSTGKICSISSLCLLKSPLAKPGPIHLLLFLSSHLSFSVTAEGGSFLDPPTSESHHAHGNLCSKPTHHLHGEGQQAALCTGGDVLIC